MGPIRPSPLRGRWGDMDEGPPTSPGLCARDRRNMDGNDSREHGCPTRRPSKPLSGKSGALACALALRTLTCVRGFPPAAGRIPWTRSRQAELLPDDAAAFGADGDRLLAAP